MSIYHFDLGEKFNVIFNNIQKNNALDISTNAVTFERFTWSKKMQVHEKDSLS